MTHKQKVHKHRTEVMYRTYQEGYSKEELSVDPEWTDEELRSFSHFPDMSPEAREMQDRMRNIDIQIAEITGELATELALFSHN